MGEFSDSFHVSLIGNEVENNGSIVNITSCAIEPEQKKMGTDPVHLMWFQKMTFASLG